MKHLLVFIYSLLVVVTVISCSGRHNDYPLAMRQAEACMEADPDSAFACLSRLRDSIAYEPKETQMYYWLLTIQADEKRYVLHTSDSLINAIVSFYRKHGDSDKLMMAYHYQGCVYRDMNDAPRAVECFLDAVDVEGTTEQNTLLGLIYGQLGTLLPIRICLMSLWRPNGNPCITTPCRRMLSRYLRLYMVLPGCMMLRMIRTVPFTIIGRQFVSRRKPVGLSWPMVY